MRVVYLLLNDSPVHLIGQPVDQHLPHIFSDFHIGTSKLWKSCSIVLIGFGHFSQALMTLSASVRRLAREVLCTKRGPI
jgi:hypothetical protein